MVRTNPELRYMRRLLFQDRVRVRASIRDMVRISFIIRVRDRVRVRFGDWVRVRVRGRVRDKSRVRVRMMVWANVTCRLRARAIGRRRPPVEESVS